MENTDLALYILVNKDIEMSRGKTAAQVGHAVQLYTIKNLNTELFANYMKGRIKKIILEDSQKNLEKYEEEGYIAIRDAGFTEIEENSLTCIAYGILNKKDVPKKIKRLRLLK